MTDQNRIYLFDTTLRDGQQTPGVDFTLEDKIAIAGMLDELGFDYVEGGYPGANPTDDAFFAEPRTRQAKFTAFGMTKRAGVSASNDPGLNAIVNSTASAICFVGKAWDYHVDLALGTTNQEHLDGVEASIQAAQAAGKEAMLDCEHFFDGYKANPDYALSVVRRAHDAGASWVVLCDTNGGTLPHEVETIMTTVAEAVPGVRLGIHAHDDTGQAVANSLAGIRAGARQVQG
ncbi:MAG: citramalate synthase, partial [Pseudomonadota bacterium]